LSKPSSNNVKPSNSNVKHNKSSVNQSNSPWLFISATLMLLGAVLVWQSDINQPAFLYLNQLGSQLHDGIWANLTLMADTLWAIAILLAVGVYKPRLLTQSLLLLILGGAFVHFFKQGLNFPRPPLVLDLDSFNLIGPKLKHESFPSGHAFTAMSCAGLVMLNMKKQWLPLLVVLTIGLLAALSRVMVGAHWPLDILVGGGTGLLFAWLCSQLELRFEFLQAHGWKFASVILLTLATIALAFHEDRYPYTQALGVLTSLTALTIAIRQFWLPFVRLFNQAN